MMAWLFLKAQGAPALVSHVTIDAPNLRATESANATVSDVAAKESGCRFTVLEKALPFPVDDAAKPILAFLPIEQELDQEIVAVTGLAASSYELSIDGVAVGRHTAGEWAKGVNLALNAAAPQVKQAQAVARLNESRRATECVLRNYAAVRWFLKHRQVNPDDLAAVATFAETKMSKTGFYEGMVATYMKDWAKRGEVVAKVTADEQALFVARKPVSHVYVLRPAQ